MTAPVESFHGPAIRGEGTPGDFESGQFALWEDAALVPKDVVLFGNLPTKNFYSDTVVPVERVRELTLEPIENKRKAGHPHIVGSECDVLYVPESAAAIERKLDVMLTCGR